MTTPRMAPVIISEKDQEALCDDLIQKHDGNVISQSQRRRSGVTIGLSDRQYYVFDHRIVFEVKAEDGKLTESQYTLLAQDYRANQIACCGTIDDLRVLIPAVRRSHAEGRALGWRIVQLWAARGFRREKKEKLITTDRPNTAPF